MSRRPRRSGWVRGLEWFLWAAGLSLLVVYTVVRIRGAIGTRREMRRFEEARAAGPAKPMLAPVEPPDMTLWSRQRLKAWNSTPSKADLAPLAILRIPKLKLEVPVLEGTDDDILNRAVGHIEGTSWPGKPGNCGIAGHRDSFFRGLKDITDGDEIDLATLSGSERYRVDDIRIVEPDRVDVLNPTPQPVVTLVTCYPFYYVGSAPRRCIVRASLVPAAAAEDRTKVQ